MDAKRKRLKLHRSNVKLITTETEVPVTVGPISGRLGLQRCSLMTVRSMTRDSRALHALGNIHLDDWEMCSGPPDI